MEASLIALLYLILLILVEGDNVLAIQAHNASSWSSDFTIIPFLSAIFHQQIT